MVRPPALVWPSRGPQLRGTTHRLPELAATVRQIWRGRAWQRFRKSDDALSRDEPPSRSRGPSSLQRYVAASIRPTRRATPPSHGLEFDRDRVHHVDDRLQPPRDEASAV